MGGGDQQPVEIKRNQNEQARLLTVGEGGEGLQQHRAKLKKLNTLQVKDEKLTKAGKKDKGGKSKHE